MRLYPARDRLAARAAAVYRTDGSDRATMVRHLEFLRLLVQSGEPEL